MLNRDFLSSVKYPALVQFVATFVVLCLRYPLTAPVFYGIVSNLIACVIGQVFSYGSCWVLVLRKRKGQRQVWTNYIIWIILLNLGTVAEMLGMA